MTRPSARMIADADAWNVTIGAVWASLLDAHAVDRRGLVVEVGPGFADKVGRGLAAHRFAGTLYVVEPSAAARDWVTQRYRQLLAGAEVVPVAEAAPEAADRLPRRVDALLMNHVLDDMVLRTWLPAAARDHVFGTTREDPSGPPEIRQSWQRLLAEPETLIRHRAGIVADVRRLLQQTTPRVFAASQYESWFLTQHGLGPVNRLGVAMLRDLEAGIGAASDADRAILAQADQNPDGWLVRELEAVDRGTR